MALYAGVGFSMPTVVCRYRPVKKYWTPAKQSVVEDDGAALPTMGAPVGQLPPNVPPYSKLGVIVPWVPP